MPNVALDILVNVVKTKILLIFIAFSSLVFIFVLVLVSSTIIQNVFVIFVIVFGVDDEKTLASRSFTAIESGAIQGRISFPISLTTILSPSCTISKILPLIYKNGQGSLDPELSHRWVNDHV